MNDSVLDGILKPFGKMDPLIKPLLSLDSEIERPSSKSFPDASPSSINSSIMSPVTIKNYNKVKPGKKKEEKLAKQQLLADFLDLTERIIESLFQCEKIEGSINLNTVSEEDAMLANKNLPSLADFSWMVIHRCQLTFSNIVLAILYLIRLKQRHPSCKGAYGSGHRLFLAALIVSNKYLYDDAYHNHTWAEVTGGTFGLGEVNRMEFELIYFLGFQLNVKEAMWLELVELLDGKLHMELKAVGCMDSKRGKLAVQCGVKVKGKKEENGSTKDEDKYNAKPKSTECSLEKTRVVATDITDVFANSKPTINTVSNWDGLDRMMSIKNQLISTHPLLHSHSQSLSYSKQLPSPLQEHGKPSHLKKLNTSRPTPPTPKKMLYLPLHQPRTPPTPISGFEADTPDSGLSCRSLTPTQLSQTNEMMTSVGIPAGVGTRQRRGSNLKYVHSPMTILEDELLATFVPPSSSVTTCSPRNLFRKGSLGNSFYTSALKSIEPRGKPLPSLPPRLVIPSSTTSLSSFPTLSFGQMQGGIGMTNSLTSQMSLNPTSNAIHPRRKSLPAFPIATNATTQVNFKFQHQR